MDPFEREPLVPESVVANGRRGFARGFGFGEELGTGEETEDRETISGSDAGVAFVESRKGVEMRGG